MPALDLTGQRFGKLIAIKRLPNKGKRTMWECKCDCGNLTQVRTENLRSGHTTSCGCKVREPSKRFINLIGQNFGEWTVIEKAQRESYWKCRCSCGVEREVYAPSLKKGISLSCGHLFKDEIKKPIIGKKYGNLLVLNQFKEGKQWYCECKCDCGNITKVQRNNLVSGNTQSCGCIVSKGEARIKRLLQENNIPFISQWTPHDCPNQKYKYDFYVNNQYVIEFDGPQHKGQISGFFTQEIINDIIKRDKEKNLYCFNHNIPIYRIPYEYRDTIIFEDLTNEKFLIKMEEAQEDE